MERLFLSLSLPGGNPQDMVTYNKLRMWIKLLTDSWKDGSPKAAKEQKLRFADLYILGLAQIYRLGPTRSHGEMICFLLMSNIKLSLFVTSFLFTRAEAAEVVVSSKRQITGEHAGVDLWWGGGIRAERKPSVEQTFLLHSDNLFFLCRREKHKNNNASPSCIHLNVFVFTTSCTSVTFFFFLSHFFFFYIKKSPTVWGHSSHSSQWQWTSQW